jgi:hypothetical protein
MTIDRFDIIAIDGERPESLDQWADRVFKTLRGVIGTGHPTLVHWYAVADTKAEALAWPVGEDRDDLKVRLERGRALSDDGHWVEDLGYSLYAWNGRDDHEIRLSINVCRHGFGLPNWFSLALGEGPPGIGPNSVDGQYLDPLFEVIADGFDPAWAVLRSSAHLHVVRPGVRPWMSWKLYLRGGDLSGIDLPAGVCRRRIGDNGWLFSLPLPVDPRNEESLRVARQMDEALAAANLPIPEIPR